MRGISESTSREQFRGAKSQRADVDSDLRIDGEVIRGNKVSERRGNAMDELCQSWKPEEHVNWGAKICRGMYWWGEISESTSREQFRGAKGRRAEFDTDLRIDGEVICGNKVSERGGNGSAVPIMETRGACELGCVDLRRNVLLCGESRNRHQDSSSVERRVGGRMAILT